ncbi:MAG: hypothetical protein R3E89_01595 [Thiolinea sp.]
MFSFNSGDVPSLELDRKVLETRLREALALAQSTDDAQQRFDKTAEYLKQRMIEAGSVDEVNRGEGLRILHLRVGTSFQRRAFVGLHYVVTPKPILEVAETTTSLLEIAKSLALAGDVETQLDSDGIFASGG